MYSMTKMLRVFAFLLFASLLISPLGGLAQQGRADGRVTLSFDKEWRFLQADTAGAENPQFNDKTWRLLDVPHDWSIEGEFNRANPTSGGGGYLPAGIGWYRKAFSLPQGDAGRRVFIEFDGVMANSTVYINGEKMGTRPFGSISFRYELTPHIKWGEKESNLLAVRVDNSLQPASRWYAGAGIFRHVRMVVAQPVYVDQWGVFVTTPQVSAAKATVKVETVVMNASSVDKEVTVETRLAGPDGKAAGVGSTKQQIAAGKSEKVVQEIEVKSPAIWSLEKTQMYSAESRILEKGRLMDNTTTPFGIRTFRFDAATGFLLNDVNIKLLGVCLHEDAGALGTAIPLSAWERRFALLKELGVNAIRTAHNPFAPEFYDLADRMGLLIMDETFDCWTRGKNKGDYHLYFNDWWKEDTRSMVMRDRNHPSIVIYSVGNEIPDMNTEEGRALYLEQQDLIHQYDHTRPVTQGLFRPAVSKVYIDGYAGKMDVVGQNYRENELVAAHEQNPTWKVVGTENGHTRQGWLFLRDTPFYAGQFLWTGIDYLGEAFWPMISADFGLLDRALNRKLQGYERESWWSKKPVVSVMRAEFNAGDGAMVADWTPVDLGTYDVAHLRVFSNCEEVELFLNDKSLGSKPINADASSRDWVITFEKGTLKAVGKNGGQVVAVSEMKTADTPAQVVLKADRETLSNTWDDVVYVRAFIADANGVICPNADSLVNFSVEGAAKLIAVDNGNRLSHESFRQPSRLAYKGTCLAILRATASKGKVTVSASVEGLKGASVTFEVLE